MIYFDTTLLVRLYLDESGYERVRELALAAEQVQSSLLGRLETAAAMHRHLREGKIGLDVFQETYQQFGDDQDDGLYTWHAMTPAILETVYRTFVDLPAATFLRTGDAIHLATAAENGFKEIYSNDKHLLAAARVFKLKGINPLVK